jgi:methylenetetrahydrofolate reductase (NADPH)
MHIQDVFARNKATFSFEFFPPKSDDGFETLFQEIAELEELKPQFVSVTYGAGGSTREQTHELVVRIKSETELDPIPHLTCVCHSEQDIAGILQRYAEAHVSNILALGGDPPKWMEDYDKSRDDFQHAADLVRFIRKFNDSGAHPDPRGFGVGVAGFPEGHFATPHRVQEMDFLKAKIDAGADYICTQLFFDNHDFYDYRERCELAGVNVPIIAGIMPITSFTTFRKLPELALGSRYPAKLLRRIEAAGDDAATLRRIGVDWATQQCRDLLDNGVAGIHFYTLNKSTATKEIYRRLGAEDSAELQDLVENHRVAGA